MKKLFFALCLITTPTTPMMNEIYYQNCQLQDDDQNYQLHDDHSETMMPNIPMSQYNPTITAIEGEYTPYPWHVNAAYKLKKAIQTRDKRFLCGISCCAVSFAALTVTAISLALTVDN